MRSHVVTAPLFLAAFLFAGCGVLSPKVCPTDLRWTVSPSAAELTVGESITARAEALGCGGTERLEEEMRWSSEDSAVAVVDRTTGRVTAQAPGHTRILGEDIGPYRIGPVRIPVTVSP